MRRHDMLIPIEIQARDEGPRRGLWPVRPTPVMGESLSSWLGRTALGNGIAPMDVLTALRRERIKTKTLDVDLEIPDAAAMVIERWTGWPARRLADMTLLSGRGTLLPVPLAKQADPGRPSPRHQYCPMCLAEDQEPYFRLLWSASWVVACLHHNILLVNGCPSCGAGSCATEIAWPFRDLAQCAACGADLRRAPRTAVDPRVRGGQALIDITHMILVRVGNPLWCQRYAEVVGNLPNALRGFPRRPAAHGGFNSLPLSRRLCHLRVLGGWGAMEALLQGVGGDALLQKFPAYLAQIRPETKTGRRREGAPRVTLFDLLSAYGGHQSAREHAMKACRVQKNHNEITLVQATRSDAAQMVAVCIAICEKETGYSIEYDEISSIENDFDEILNNYYAWVFFFVRQEIRIGFVILCGNHVIHISIFPELQKCYSYVVGIVQKLADWCLRDSPFEVLEAAVSASHRPSFTEAGWQDTGRMAAKHACDRPAQGSVHIMTRAIVRAPVGP